MTNERIVLNGYYSAIIIPRVKLSEIGIIVTPAYIDPFYDGILRLLVTNTSDFEYKLKALEVIAQCYFFKFPQPVPENFKQEFAHKSDFYGKNWQSIINEDARPFPTRKEPAENSIIENIKSQFRNIYYWIKEHALITSIIGLVSLGYAGYKQIKSNQIHKIINQLLKL